MSGTGPTQRQAMAGTAGALAAEGALGSAPRPVVTFTRTSIHYGALRAVHDVTLQLNAGEILGIVGESGSGKSTLVTAVLGAISGHGHAAAGDLSVLGTPVLDSPRSLLDRLRGDRIALVPQNPAQALAPHRRVGRQMEDVLAAHGRPRDRAHIVSLLERVGLPDPPAIARRYPHQMSGGQQQRVCIAMALLCAPAVLVLDEPTTGLDVTTQRQIITLLKGLRDETGMAMLYVTHDLALLGTIADRIAVMYAGHVVEVGQAGELLNTPQHPYTRGLIASVPHLDALASADLPLTGTLVRATLPPGCPFQPRCPHALAPRCATEPQALRVLPSGAMVDGQQVACWRAPLVTARAGLPPPPRGPVSAEAAEILAVEQLTVVYPTGSWLERLVRGRPATPLAPALDRVSLTLRRGEVLALVGESGSGKSTLARAVMGIAPVVGGQVRFAGTVLAPRLRQRGRAVRQALQYIFQNPDASLNPRASVAEIIARPARQLLGLSAPEAAARVAQALAQVRLDPAYARRLPGQLSGGERQRVAIARAFIVQPQLVLCDEILSALDASVQAGVLDLLEQLRAETGVAMLFISHDLAVVRRLADRVMVLHQGRLVEEGPTEQVFTQPAAAYTRQLLAAAPRLSEAR